MLKDNVPPVTVVNLPLLSANFPQDPSPELLRDNVIGTIEQLLGGGALNIVVEGDEGMGKTTVLCQFARKHPHHAVSVFISAFNKLSFDADLILQDLFVQVGWIVRREVLQPDSASVTALKSFYGALQREAKREGISFYFLIDGSEELDESHRTMLFQYLSDLLPIGVPQFRFLVSGSSQAYRGLFPRAVPLQPYPLNLLSVQETRTLLSRDIPDDQLADVHQLCRGIPGRVASVLRVLSTGVTLPSYLENAPSKSPEFFEAEWRQVPDGDEQLKQILALLAHDSKPHSVRGIAETLGLTVADVEQRVACLNFLSVENTSKAVNFVSGPLRRFIAIKLADRKGQVLKKLIKKLLAAPESDESIFDLPGYLEESSEFLDVLELLTPDHIVEVLKRGGSLSKVNEAVQRGLRAARRLGKDYELLRFGIQSAVIAELETSGIWVSEVEALAALGRDSEALGLVNNAVLCEDKLQLLAALAASVWKREETVSKDLLAQLGSLVERADGRSLRRRGREIASQLVCVSPDLAIAVMDKIRGFFSEENDLDQVFVHSSLQALTGVKDEKRRDELLRNISLVNPEPQLQAVLSGLRALSQRLSASEVRSTVDSIAEIGAKLSILRAWCVLNASDAEAGLVAEYALEVALKETAYTIDASVLADLARPLRSMADETRRTRLISQFDALTRNAARLGPSIKYVQFQLDLAGAASTNEPSFCEARLTRLFEYTTSIDDLPSKAEAFGTILVALNVLGEFPAKSKFRILCTGEIDTIALALAETTADHYLAFKGLICALSTGELDKALDYVKLVNTRARRDEILGDVVTTLTGEPARDIDPQMLKRVVDQIADRDQRDSALETIMDRFGDARNLPSETVDALTPLIDYLSFINDSMIACDAMVSAFKLITKHLTPEREKTRAQLWDRIRERWSHIDIGWNRIDIGFNIANDLAPTCKEYAAIVVKETEELKESWRICAYEPASAYVSCIRLVIRAFRGLLPRRLDTPLDVNKLVSLIDVLPSYGERAILWADLAMRCSLAGRQDLCETLVKKYLRPVLDQIPTADAAYRARVIVATAPALNKVFPESCLEMLSSLEGHWRDIALRDVIRFELYRRVPSDPIGAYSEKETPASYDVLLQIVSLLERVNTDWMIYAVANDITEVLALKSNRLALNNPQRDAIAARVEAIAKQKLPIKDQIEHPGWQILTIAKAYCIKGARDEGMGFSNYSSDQTN